MENPFLPTIYNVYRIMREDVNPMLVFKWKQHKRDNYKLVSILDDSFKFKAYATEELIENENMYSIHISVGSLCLIHDYLRVFLSSDKIFPGIGTSSFVMKLPTLREPNYNVLIGDIYEIGFSELDEKREKLHWFLFTIISKFIVYHEYTHIVNGHIGLVKENKHEVKNSNGVTKELSKLDYQTLELDSDACAICDLYEEYISRLKNGDPDIPDMINSQGDIIYSLTVCHLILMNMSTKYSMTFDIMKESTHPYSTFRSDLISSTLITKLLDKEIDICLESSKNSYINFIDAIVEVIDERAFEEMKWHIDNNLQMDYRRKMGLNWNYLRPKLEKFALAELPALYE